MASSAPTRPQETALVVLRTLIGWHFGSSLECGPEAAVAAARACIAGAVAIETRQRVVPSGKA
jgi:hypothetical protein